jgi:hypothetical protein
MPKYFILLLTMLLLLPACTPEQEETGVVARVNGRPISFRSMESRHDFKHLNQGDDINPSVERLKQSYGVVLTELIIRELVAESLDATGHPVSEMEIVAAEDEIRTDYKDGAFEQVLIEEYIDIESWRRELKADLQLKKFIAEVLRPMVTLDYKEVEDFYKDNVSDFYISPRVRFVYVQSGSEKKLRTAMQHLQKNGNFTATRMEFPRVELREMTATTERLSAEMGAALENLNPGRLKILSAESGAHRGVYLLEKTPARVLTPTEAYPLVEDVLLEEKLASALDLWLDETLATAVIEVSPHIKPEHDFAQPDDDASSSPLFQGQGALRDDMPEGLSQEAEDENL